MIWSYGKPGDVQQSPGNTTSANNTKWVDSKINSWSMKAYKISDILTGWLPWTEEKTIEKVLSKVCLFHFKPRP